MGKKSRTDEFMVATAAGIVLTRTIRDTDQPSRQHVQIIEWPADPSEATEGTHEDHLQIGPGGGAA